MKVCREDLEAALSSGSHLTQLARDIGCNHGTVVRAEERYGIRLPRVPHGARGRPVGIDGIREAVQDMAPLDAVEFLLDVLGDLVGALPQGGPELGWPDVHLTPVERSLLQMLFRHEGRTVSRGAIMDGLYGHSPSAPQDRVLDVFICKIRAKLVGRGVTIETTYGVGWMLTRAPGAVFPWERVT